MEPPSRGACFGLAYLHALLVERRTFGALGFSGRAFSASAFLLPGGLGLGASSPSFGGGGGGGGGSFSLESLEATCYAWDAWGARGYAWGAGDLALGAQVLQGYMEEVPDEVPWDDLKVCTWFDLGGRLVGRLFWERRALEEIERAGGREGGRGGVPSYLLALGDSVSCSFTFSSSLFIFFYGVAPR